VEERATAGRTEKQGKKDMEVRSTSGRGGKRVSVKNSHFPPFPQKRDKPDGKRRKEVSVGKLGRVAKPEKD